MYLVKTSQNESNLKLIDIIRYLVRIRSAYKEAFVKGKINQLKFAPIDIRFKAMMAFLTWGALNALTQMSTPLILMPIFKSDSQRAKVKDAVYELMQSLKGNEKNTYRQFVSIYQFLKDVFGNNNHAWKEMVDCIEQFEGK
jgi:hypothetical protein